VRLGAGELTPPTESELRKVPAERLAQGWRLACQARPLSARVSIEVPQTGGRRQILTASGLSHGRAHPAVQRETITLPRPTFEDARSDAVRLEDHLGMGITPLAVLGSLPQMLRSNGFKATITRSGGSVIDIEPSTADDHAFGAAIDIGTSKVITYLFDLHAGRLIDQDAV
jgi:uncharacterized 2Fe-2S/4Fe-4S cluster protein (DUF4445 family)